MVNIKPMISFVAFDEKEYDAYLGCHLADLLSLLIMKKVIILMLPARLMHMKII